MPNWNVITKPFREAGKNVAKAMNMKYIGMKR